MPVPVFDPDFSLEGLAGRERKGDPGEDFGVPLPSAVRIKEQPGKGAGGHGLPGWTEGGGQGFGNVNGYGNAFSEGKEEHLGPGPKGRFVEAGAGKGEDGGRTGTLSIQPDPG